MEELGLAAFMDITLKIRLGLAAVRRGAVKHADATRGSAEYFFKFVQQHPTEMLVGLRMLNGPSPLLRKAMRDVFDEMAAEIAQDVSLDGRAPVNEAALKQVTSAIVYHLFYKSQDYVEFPDQRQRIVDETVAFSRMLFFGAVQLHADSG